MAKPKMYLLVRGDWNDADYVTEITQITQKELDRFAPLFKAIKNFKPYKGFSDPEHHKSDRPPLEWTHDHNWGVGEYGYRDDLGAKSITELYGELAEEFDEGFVPHGENGSLHTIHAISVVTFKKQIFSTGRG
jgi:hypothetical protein